MPGREELIQQNIARARTSSQTQNSGENKGQESTFGSPPRSNFGGNIDVYRALDRIGFTGGFGDASMRGNTAYIRLWKREGTAQQASSVNDISTFPDLQESFSEEFSSRVDFSKYFTSSTSENFAYSPNSTEESQFSLNESFTNPVRFNNFLPYTPVSFQTPTSSGPITPSTTENQGETNLSATPSPAAGTIKSANPDGGINSETPSTASSGEMVWQFLFNPSELELEVGPEFKNAETWGVSDKGNSGQPLHWSHNKNALLKFNSVLLNGFIFGRKVEVLEQGIIELFMARDGDGQHGPHVLEFVWGKRVFGPCVIKNINIKEKMWDEGEVVNAELNFTLEQVPEWTINDGFVDVARPGRIGLQGDVTDPNSSVKSPNEENPESEPEPESKPEPEPNKGKSSAFCKQARGAYTNFNSLGRKSGQNWIGDTFGGSESRAEGLLVQYRNLLIANKSVVSSMSGIDPKCTKNYGCDYPIGTSSANETVGCVRLCSYQIASKIDGFYLKSNSCKNVK